VQDVRGFARSPAARHRHLLDNTWATPLLFRHSPTGSTSRSWLHEICLVIPIVMMGYVTATEQHWSKLSRTAQLHGQYVSRTTRSVARGLRTLGLRLRRHEENAWGSHAGWRSSHKWPPSFTGVRDVPRHAMWKRDFDDLCLACYSIV
jgi:cystathionine beta-lyase